MPKLERRWWRPVSDYAEAQLHEFIYTENGRPELFLKPHGEAALVPADGVNAKVYSVPLTVYIGGITAVILELAEPRVRHGVWDHSVFPTDPILRLRRTGLAAMVTFYAAASVARRMIAEVNRKHAGVRGETSSGDSYHALDQELLTWVQATAAYGFITAYDTYAEHLSVHAWDTALREAVPVAACYGVKEPPVSKAALGALMATTLPTLEPSDTLSTFLSMMKETPTLPAPAHHLQPVFVRAAVSLLPPEVMHRLELVGHGLQPAQRALVASLVKGSRLLRLRNHPAELAKARHADACAR